MPDPLRDLLRDQLQTSLGTAYTLGRELGGGGMSRVFVAREEALGRDVVVKVLAPELAQGLSAERFAREIKLAAALQEPHIVPVLAAGVTADGLPYYTMPYVRGASLRQRIVEGPLPLPEAAAILRDVARALAYAHAQGVVHRDVKPENVLLSSGTAVVTDFGIAKAMAASKTGAPGGPAGGARTGSLTQPGISLGTPAYMAPEQAVGDDVDARADLYAWGVIAYELLAGLHPFAGKSTAQQLIAAHLAEAPPLLATAAPDVPVALTALVTRCLEKDPERRPPHAADLVRVLDAVAAGDATRASGELGRRVWRGRAFVVVALLAAGTAAVAVGGTWLTRVASGPERSATHGARRVAVAPFANLTGDPRDDHVGPVVADWLTQGLSQQAESLDVVSADVVAAALDTAASGNAAGRGGAVDRLGRVTHATLVVTGSVARHGDSLRFQAALADPRTGTVVRTLAPATGAAVDPMPAIDLIRERLLGAFATSGDTRPRSVPMLPPTYAAYREFLAGRERHVRYGDFPGAIAHYDRAIQLDSTYTAPFAYLAMARVNLGAYDAAAAVVRRMAEGRLRLTPSERDMREYVESYLDGDFERTLRALQRFTARDTDPLAVWQLAAFATRLLRPGLARAAYAEVDSVLVASGWVWQTTGYAAAMHEGGDDAMALAMLRRRRRDFPGHAAVPAAELQALAGLQRGAAALALADTILRLAPSGPGTDAIDLVLAGAEECAAHGDAPTGAAIARRVLAVLAVLRLAEPEAELAKGGSARQARRALQAGRAWLLAGRPDSALGPLARASRDTARVDAFGYLGVALARTGDHTRARALADSLSHVRRRWTFGRLTYWRAAITAELADHGTAIQLLQEARREGAWPVDWHAALELSALRGDPAFAALVTPR